MPQDDPQNQQPEAQRPAPAHSATIQSDWRNLFAVPAPVKKVFQKFPLVTYPRNEYPLRTPRERHLATLYIFSDPEGVQSSAPSYNPSCLKWQTYLKLSGIEFRTAASNNHASPTGVLPFLLPGGSASKPDAQAPIPANKLRAWAAEHGNSVEDNKDLRSEAYMSLLDHRIRRAWLYTLYLEPDNFTAVANRLYVQTSSSSLFVNLTISHQLRQAAEAELLKQTPVISVQDVLRDAAEAFSALSTLLGGDEWFFGSEKPGLFDASVFAYTHLLLDEEMGWRVNEVGFALKGYSNLVRHRKRVYKQYFC